MERPYALGSRFERLEDRNLPSAFGIPWADPGHLTLSFVPDGTSTPTGPSRLFATMNPVAPTATWEREILRAFQSWAVNANLNVGVVADGGQPLGSLGAVQGDARFGDIRIAAAPIADSEIAAASPFSWTGTTFAGDVTFGSTRPYSVGNDPDAFDIFSIAAHEAGHSLGLDHSTAADSVRQEDYVYRTGLGATDVADLQALYGPRLADQYDDAATNDTIATATALKGRPVGTDTRFTADGDLTTLGDVDFYKFKLPSATGQTVTVRLQAKGLSLLLPAVTVYDSAGQVVGSASATDPLNNDVGIQLTGVKPGSTYTVCIDHATPDVFGIGSYRLTIDVPVPGSSPPAPSPLVSPVPDGHTDDTLNTALVLNPKKAPVPDARFSYTYQGVVEDTTDVDTYKIRADKVRSAGPMNLNVMVWGLNASPLNPRVRVFDATGTAVAFQVLANTVGIFSIQVPDVVPGGQYYVQVSARIPDGANGTGGYFLGADFNRSALTTYDEVASNSLGPTATTDTGTISVATAGLYQFSLAAEPLVAGAGGVTMLVTDPSGRMVFSLDVTAGDPAVTAVQYLSAGTYTVTYTFHSGTSRTAAPIRYDLSMLELSDPVGTYPTTTTTTSPTSPTSPMSPTSPTSPTSGTTYTGSFMMWTLPSGYFYFF
jgi:hypothetical protein